MRGWAEQKIGFGKKLLDKKNCIDTRTIPSIFLFVVVEIM